MSFLNNNIAHDTAKLSNASAARFRNSSNGRLKLGLVLVFTDRVFLYTILAMLAKSILFLGLINSDNAASFSMLKALKSFSSPPPLIVYVLFSTAFLSFSFLLRGRLHFLFLLGANFLFSALLIVDLMYYRGFASFLTPYLLNQTSNLESLSSSVVSMLRPVDLLFLVDFIFLPIIGRKFGTFYAKTERNVWSFVLLLTLSISSIYLLHYKVDIKGTDSNQMLFKVAWVPNQTMSNLSPLGYHIFDLYNYHKYSKPYQLTTQENQDIQSWLANNKENLPPNQYAGMFQGQNVLFIQVESLENVILNKQVNGQEITPTINSLLDNSLYFSNFYEQVYNGNSSDAELMSNTSVYPVRLGSAFFRFPNNTYNSLPNLLEDEGYSTLAIHPDKGSYWNWMPAFTGMGFDKNIDVSYFNQDEKIGLGISDASYLRQSVPLITEQKQPFYTFMITMTSHNPFDLPAEYRGLTLEKEVDQTKLGGYFQSINYTDRQLGIFLDDLDKNGLLENTVVVIYGDHTGVHKYYNDEIRQMDPAESWWLDDSKRVPLLIYHKGMKGQEITTTGGQIDILPTVSYVMGVDEEKYQDTALGRNLLNTKQDFAVMANGDYVGRKTSKEEEEKLIKGIGISDLIIRSNYFKGEEDK